MYRTLLALSLLLLLAAGTVAQRAPGGRMPGEPEPGGDWYNLGPIGGKASLDASPGSGAASGLDVQTIIDDAPGAKAGLKVGDVIIGAPKDFGANAYHELGAAIELAEAAKKAKDAIVKLTILRAGKEQTLDVQVPEYGKDAKDFPGGKMRDVIVEKSLAWLAAQQQGDGGWECYLSGENGRVVMTSLCGLAMLAAGNTAAKGTYKKNIENAVKFVSENIGKESDMFGKAAGGANWNQTNWGLGYGGIFLAEVQAASPIKGLDDKLKWVAETILANMEQSGGFAHGPGGPNALDYLELEIVSNYCLAALGGCKACGVKVDAKQIDKALDYIQKCGGGKGGVGYSTQPGQVGWGDPGRTGGAIMAYGAVGRSDHEFYKPMCGYLQANLRDIIDGHVSPTMHHLSAAAACRREGDKAWDKYWEAQRQECTMLRNPDCTFTGRPTKESQTMGRNNDLDMGTVWNTAHWTIILCLEKDNLPVWFGKSGKKKPEKVEEKKEDPTTGEKKTPEPEKKKPDIDDILDD